MSLNGKPVRGVLLDITGVLMDSSSVRETGLDIPGSVEAVQKLLDAGAFIDSFFHSFISIVKSLSHSFHLSRSEVSVTF